MKPGTLVLALMALGCAAALAATGARPASSPRDVFESMQQSFVPEEAEGIRATYQWHLSGPHGGDWFIVVNNGQQKIGKGVIANPDVVFVCSADDWVELSNGTLNGTWAYLTGRLQIRGSQALARKLDEMFP
jgi:putative sterol carrier protein